MKALLALGSVFLAGIPLSAQTSDGAASSPANPRPAVAYGIVSSGQNCPVALDASRDPEGSLVRTAPAKRLEEQRLRLYLTPSTANGVAEADFTVHGMVGAAIIPADAQSQRHATEDFHVAPSAGENHRFATTVSMKRLTGIDYVELTSIRFADGNEWHRSATSACRVTPSGFKLVASSH